MSARSNRQARKADRREKKQERAVARITSREVKQQYRVDSRTTVGVAKQEANIVAYENGLMPETTASSITGAISSVASVFGGSQPLPKPEKSFEDAIAFSAEPLPPANNKMLLIAAAVAAYFLFLKK